MKHAQIITDKLERKYFIISFNHHLINQRDFDFMAQTTKTNNLVTVFYFIPNSYIFAVVVKMI